MAPPTKNQDLHGSVPDSSSVALILIDLINDFEFVDSEDIFQQTLSIAPTIAKLIRKARKAQVPVIYVNDNFGKWQSDFTKLLDHCLHDEVKGKPVVELLQPDEHDYSLLKPKHSGFYSTTLDVLLAYLKAKTLVLAGISGNSCVLFTASDVFMRDYSLVIASDCIASATPEENEYALEQMGKVLKARILSSTRIDFKKLRQA